MIKNLRIVFTKEEKTIGNIKKFLAVIGETRSYSTSQFFDDKYVALCWYAKLEDYRLTTKKELDGTEISWADFLAKYDSVSECELTHKEHVSARMRDEVIDIHNAPADEIEALVELLEYMHEPMFKNGEISNSYLHYFWSNNLWIGTNKSISSTISIVDFVAKYDIRKDRIANSTDPVGDYLAGEVVCKPIPVQSDGGRNDFYTFPKYVVNIDKLCRFLKLSSAEGNILKSLTVNLGQRHDATDTKREVKKCLHYAIERMQWNDFTDEEILAQVKKHLEVKKDVQ